MHKSIAAALALLGLVAILAPGTLAPAHAQPPTPLAADPYGDYTIDFLATRSYGGGTLTLHEVMESTTEFNRFLISYPSDGLSIYGFLNVPQGPGPFPVIIALHGYIEPELYDTLDYTTPYADALARAG